MSRTVILLILIFILFILYPSSTKPVLATRFSLVAPSGTLQRGGTARFTVNIDTEGETVKEAQIGSAYQSQYLEFINAVPTDDFPNITVNSQSEASMIISGSNPAGFTGQGVFTYLDFKIIAETSGSAQICELFAPTPSGGYPSSPHTSTPLPTYPKSSPPPASSPTPPRSGYIDELFSLSLLGAVLILFRVIYSRTNTE